MNGPGSGSGGGGGGTVTGTGTATENAYWVGGSVLGSASFDKYIMSGSSIEAAVYSNAAGTPVRIEVFPDVTNKPNEGAALTPGTIAWAESQLAGGGEIYLHAGTFNVGTTIVMNVAGTSLRCADNQVSELKAATDLNAPILQVGDFVGTTQKQGMQIAGCAFNGNALNQSGTGFAMVDLKNTADARIEDNYIRYWRTTGLRIGCSLTGTRCVDNLVARNNFFSSGGNASRPAGSAILLDSSGSSTPLTDGRIVDNDIGGSSDNGDGSSAWIKIGDGTGEATTGWSIQGNHIYSTDRGPCIEIADPTANTIDIQNNTLESCTGAIKWTGDATGSAGWSLIQGNKMYGYSRQCSAVGSGNYLGKRCAVDADCGTGGTCAAAGPVVFNFIRSLRNSIVGNHFRGQQGGVTSYIGLSDPGGNGSNHNLISANEMDFTVAGEKGITFANSSANNVVSGNKCRGIGGGGGGTCIDGGSIGGNQFLSNACNNVCTALETNIPAYSATTIHDLNTSGGPYGDFTCTAGSCALVASSVADGDLINAYSGVGACTASKWVSTLTRNAAPTCTQPSFADLSGTLAHSALSGLSSDDHTQYVMRLGRTGLTNDITVSSDANGTISGGALASGQLILQSNRTNVTTGSISLIAPSIVVPGTANLLFDSDSTATQNFITFTDGTETISGIYTGVQFSGGTYTLNTNTSGMLGFNFPSTATISYTAATNPVFSSISNLFNANSKISIASGAAVSGTWATPFVAAHTFEASGASTVATLSAPGADFTSTPTFAVAASGSFGAASDRYSYYSKPTVNTGATIQNFRGLYIANKTGAGTLNNYIGIDIENLSGAASKQIGIRNFSTTSFTSAGVGSAADPGAGFTLTPDSTSKLLTPTGGSRTSDTTTAISDGVLDGQIFYIVNAGSANTVTIKNNANTDFGAADCVLNRGGVLQVMWNAGDSNWLQVSCSPN